MLEDFSLIRLIQQQRVELLFSCLLSIVFFLFRSRIMAEIVDIDSGGLGQHQLLLTLKQ